MKKTCLLSLIVLLALPALAVKTRYWVQFKDRNGSPYSTSNPSVYLSSKAIARRTAQNITIKTNDLPINPNYISGVLSQGAVTLLNKSKWFNAITISTTDQVALGKIKALSYVVKVDSIAPLKSIDDYNAPKLEGPVFNTAKKKSIVSATSAALPYGPSLNQAAMIKADCMHNLGYMGQGMTIAVLDAGFERVDSLIAFDSLRANGQILGTWDYVAGNSSVYEDHWHGMMVLSNMGGYMKDSIVGTAPKAKYWLLRTEDAGTETLIEEDNWVSAAEFADSAGADLINTSLGYTTFDDTLQNHTYAMMNGNTTRISIGADIAVSKGMFVSVSAGNEGSNAWKMIGAPADADSVLTVGSVNGASASSGFSSRGPTVDGQIKPDVAAQGEGAICANPWAKNHITPANGTSFASPIMCGGAACLWGANPGKTSREIYFAIIQSASKYSTPDSFVGYGIPDLCKAHTLLSTIEYNAIDDKLEVFPNPFTNDLRFSFSTSSGQRLKVSLLDVTGRTVLLEEMTVVKGTAQLGLSGSKNLSKGTYVLSLESEKGRYARIVMKD